jgi:Icc-related predicted phosphoesterase
MNGQKNHGHGSGTHGAHAERLRLAAVADLHCTRASRGKLRPLFARMGEEADVILFPGDLTDYGLPEEARVLAQELKDVRGIPMIAVLGNHDFHSDRQEEVKTILAAEAGVRVLDGDSLEIQSVGFTGVKGFMGGFDNRMLQAWGEPVIKLIVHEAMEESLKLETGLARLKTRHRIVVLHYAPVRATVVGEPPEIQPFLGSSRLEEALHRHRATAVFHGHAHYGSPEGTTSDGIPVFNVALPLLKRRAPQRPAFRKVELPLRVEHVT